jgi:hypothetical protein
VQRIVAVLVFFAVLVIFLFFLRWLTVEPSGVPGAIISLVPKLIVKP